ncbi:hypothetical protein LR48_Vigan04g156700 [Vigna angularis]|uniref:Uncharacterized protein n=3 Tax=Vigna TaxID=3913 RepID=A0A0L9UFP3_PHAAN|nr:uncharacterized protein HKW66_Vig0104890 [Vigna angularis]KOM41369.1 hypothetical protein LR48_Vigan04g156700 [Vigna angularis]BAT78857.1 hypothetical protein VIGAN_02160500 [Vigna angularis var. angularis]
MALKITTFLLLLLLLLLPLSSGLAEGFRENMHPTRGLPLKVKSRKLFGHDFVLDYDEAGANPRHTKKPGKGP